MDQRALRERLPVWVEQMREVASKRPETGACAVGTAMELWAWTFDKMKAATARNPAAFDAVALCLADSLGLLMSARALVLDVAEAATEKPGEAETTQQGQGDLLVALCHSQVTRTCSETGRACAEVVFGSLRHPAWETDAGCCYHASDLEMIEQYMPGIASCARAYSDVIEQDGTHPSKAGPCVRFEGFEEFVQLRTRLDGCLAGGFVARRRAAEILNK